MSFISHLTFLVMSLVIAREINLLTASIQDTHVPHVHGRAAAALHELARPGDRQIPRGEPEQEAEAGGADPDGAAGVRVGGAAARSDRGRGKRMTNLRQIHSL